MTLVDEYNRRNTFGASKEIGQLLRRRCLKCGVISAKKLAILSDPSKNSEINPATIPTE